MKLIFAAVLSAAVALSNSAAVFAQEEETLKPFLMNKPETVKQTTTVQPIEDFEESIPDVSEMKLRLKEFAGINDTKTRESAELLYAKGYLEDVDEDNYNSDTYLSTDDYKQILSAAFHLDKNFWPQSGETLDRKTEAAMISSAMQNYRKMYHMTDKQAASYQRKYSDLKQLTKEESESVYNLLYMNLLATKSNKEIGTDVKVTYKEAINLIADVLLKTDLIALGKGADMPFTEYETEYCENTGTEIVSDSFVDGPAFEALGRKVIALTSSGEYIRFENLPECNRVFIRYSIPNPELVLGTNGNAAEGGSDYSTTLAAYVNGEKYGNVELTARPLYGEKDVSVGSVVYNKNYYNMANISDIYIPEGGEFVLRKEAENTGEAYYIDSVYFEMADAPIEKPEGFLDVRDYGAVPDDAYDDTEAFTRCLYDAEYKSKGIYIPAGEFFVTEMMFVGSGITIQGAGMHHTILTCNKPTKAYWQFGGRGTFGLNGDNITIRDVKFFNSDAYVRGSGRDGSMPLLGRVASNNLHFENIIIENTQCGAWLTCTNSSFRNIRIIHTFADGIHFTNNSYNNIVENCYMLGLGDDAVATTSDGPPTLSHDMVWRNNTVRQIYWGRGMMISGAYDMIVENNIITDVCHEAGLLFITESSYNTYSAYRITARENTVIRCGNRDHKLAAVTVQNRHTGFYADADLYDNEVYGTLITDTFGNFENNGKVYSEVKNNIFQNPKDRSCEAIVRPTPNSASYVIVEENKILSSR